MQHCVAMRRIGRSGTAIVGMLVFTSSCAGPQRLSRAIRDEDRALYTRALNAANGDARSAFTKWMAEERGTGTDELINSDAMLSAVRNPFDAHRDPVAVSRGAVIYEIHCGRCHGEIASGGGPSSLAEHPATSFKTLGKRIGATLHRGAPRKWFRVIRDGSGDIVEYPDGRTSAMPAFGQQLGNEQIWLVVTYLQSLEIHASRSGLR
jgi:mono/diheme cytochrome c family protein